MTKISKTQNYKYINVMVASMAIYATTNLESNFKIVLYVFFLLLFILLFRDLLRQYYISSENDKVVIRNLIRTSTFEKQDIDSIHISKHPLRRSYFQLINGQKYKFEAWSLSKKELEKFKEINPNVT